jgi:UDP-glucose 4-epimerase
MGRTRTTEHIGARRNATARPRRPITHERILIFGSNGYLGKHLVAHLNSKHYIVFASTRNGSYACDITNATAVKELISAIHPDVVINAAGYGIDPAERELDGVMKVNFGGIINIAPVCQVLKIPLITIGSYLEYGNVETPYTEDMIPRPTTTYGIAKNLATEFCGIIRNEGSPLAVLRLSTLIGGQEPPYRLLTTIRTAFERGETPQLSNPNNHRDFLAIEDAVTAIEAAIEHNLNGVYNVCTGKETTIQEVVALTHEHYLTAPMPTYGNTGREYEYAVSAGDNTKFRNATGWRPMMTVADTIRNSIKDHNNEDE